MTDKPCDPKLKRDAVLAHAENEQEQFTQKFDELVTEREKIGRKLDRLRDASIKAIKRRERVPQPLFWSLFHTELSEIKKRKEAERRARALLLR